jgi:ATP-binding cassette subfamily C protein
MLETLRRALAMLDRDQQRRWRRLVLFAVAASALESLGAVAVVAFVGIISGGSDLSNLPIVGSALAPYSAMDRRFLVLNAAAGVALFFIAKNAFVLFQVREQEFCAMDSTVAVATGLFGRYLGAPYTFHLGRNSADLITNVDLLPDTVYRYVLQAAVILVSESLIMASLLTLLLIAEPLVTLSVAGTMGGLMAAIVSVTHARHHRWGTESQEFVRQGLQALQQGLASLKEIKVLGREAFFRDQYSRHRIARGRVQGLASVAGHLPRMALETTVVCGMALTVAALQLSRDAASGDIFVVIGLFAYAGFRVMPSSNRIINALNTIRQGAEAVNKVWQDHRCFDPCPEVRPHEPLPFGNALVCENLCFSFTGNPLPVLNDLNLAIPRGTTLGLAGLSGAGKSTLVDLLLGLLSPTAGRILVDGIDIADRLPAWRQGIGYVPQNFALIDDSLRRNVAFGLPDAEIDDARVRRALDFARLTDWVATLPDGLEASLGERGVRLSGGQRQRISLARALYTDPAVLVFDEATSALDTATEEEIAAAIDRFAGEKTIIIIAHRPSSLMRCRQVAFLMDGQVAAQGPYQVLIDSTPEFRRMVEASLMAERVP